MNFELLKADVKSLIAKDKVEEAIKLLITYIGNKEGKEQEALAYMLSAKMVRILKDFSLEIIDWSKFSAEKSLIIVRVFDVLYALEESRRRSSSTVDTPQKHKKGIKRKLGLGFGSELEIDLDMYIQDIEFADLNGDGALDLVSTGRTTVGSDGYTFVSLGDGNGNFGTQTSYAAETNNSQALKLGDINNDGILDLVTAGESDTLDGYATVRLGDGSGSFGAATSYFTQTTRSYDINLGDVNGDGNLDLITADSGG